MSDERDERDEGEEGVERLRLYDTTLRDGQQTPGIDFTLADKHEIARMLDELGIDYIEGGYPGANPLDSEFFASPPRLTRSRLSAFGMVSRPGRSADNDPGVVALLEARADAICFVAKSWDYHVRVALQCEKEDNLRSIRDSVSAASASGREVLLDCEHFFDGFRSDSEYALACAEAAADAGASWVVLCDTNGGAMPWEIEKATSSARSRLGSRAQVGIHAHDDTGQAAANSLAGVLGGARQIQGTLNGIGERCGNANLTTLIPTLSLKPWWRERFAVGVDEERLKSLTSISRRFDERLNRAPDSQAPYVGSSAFATKAGIHASGILKEAATYEHAPPESVGNRRRLLASAQGGRAALVAELSRLGLEVERDDSRLDGFLDEIKRGEARGVSYEAASASFELAARRVFDDVPRYYEVETYRVVAERRRDARGNLKTVADAVVKVKVDGETILSAGEGNGPVNALDMALRSDLGRYSRHLENLALTDYRVRVLGGGTDAVTRVLIDFVREGVAFTTMGVSPNIVDASFKALDDAIVYALLRDGAPAP